MWWKVMPLSLLILIMMACTGCTIGIKQSHEILMVSPVPIPEAAKGAPVIATNEKIRLGVLKKPDAFYHQKVTGYVLVDPWFYEKLLDAYKKQRKDK
jgi:hypothetical protein